MAEIIPSINVRTFEEVKERVAKIEPYVLWCHLDVTDGVFSAHQTWNNPDDLGRLETRLSVEVHLMVDRPEKILDQWLRPPVRRVIVHIEATDVLEEIIERCRNKKTDIGIAMNPDTPWEIAKPSFGHVDLAQVLSVNPGPPGQTMRADAFEKTAAIRRACPSCRIEFDGGVNPETAKRAREAGADILVAGSYIFHAENVSDAIASLGGR